MEVVNHACASLRTLLWRHHACATTRSSHAAGLIAPLVGLVGGCAVRGACGHERVCASPCLSLLGARACASLGAQAFPATPGALRWVPTGCRPYSWLALSSLEISMMTIGGLNTRTRFDAHGPFTPALASYQPMDVGRTRGFHYSPQPLKLGSSPHVHMCKSSSSMYKQRCFHWHIRGLLHLD